MEYVSAVWDLYYNLQIQQLEKVAMMLCSLMNLYNDYSRFSSVSAMLSVLSSWPSLETRYIDYKPYTRHCITSLLSPFHHITYHQ